MRATGGLVRLVVTAGVVLLAAADASDAARTQRAADDPFGLEAPAVVILADRGDRAQSAVSGRAVSTTAVALSPPIDDQVESDGDVPPGGEEVADSDAESKGDGVSDSSEDEGDGSR